MSMYIKVLIKAFCIMFKNSRMRDNSYFNLAIEIIDTLLKILNMLDYAFVKFLKELIIIMNI